MRTTALGIVGGLVLVVSALHLYQGVGVGILTCPDRHSSELCEANYVRTAAAEAGVLIGVAACVGALWRARRKS